MYSENLTLLDAVKDLLARIVCPTDRSHSVAEERVHDFANVLGWDSNLQEIDLKIESTAAVKGIYDGQPLTVLGTASGLEEREWLDTLISCAYQANVSWGMALQADHMSVFNPHWVSGYGWTEPLRVHLTNEVGAKSVLDAFTPRFIAEGRVDSILTTAPQPTSVLRPIDDAFVDKLERWRREALRYSSEFEDLDLSLHHLFAQLFLLRAIEDRKLACGPYPLSVTVGSGNLNRDKLRNLYAWATKEIQGTLFSSLPFESFPDFIIVGLIDDLYRPSQMPDVPIRYDFSWIGSDILGRAYEKYLDRVYTAAPIGEQLYLFDPPAREVEPISVRKARGVYYTPSYLVNSLVETSIREYRSGSENSDRKQLPKIVDFACGSGSFLVSALDALFRENAECAPERDVIGEIVQGKLLQGFDIDARAVELARVNIWLKMTEVPGKLSLPLPSMANLVQNRDSLSNDLISSTEDSFDIVLGNPPFSANSKVELRKDQIDLFKSAAGRFDISYLFVELGLSALKESGIVAMVVPNRMFTNRDASIIRELLVASCDLICLVDFQDTKVFSASAYVGALVARVTSSDSQRIGQVRVVKVDPTVDKRYLGSMLTRSIVEEHDTSVGGITSYNVPQPEGPHPWSLLSPEDSLKRMQLENQGEELSSLAIVRQGIRTGANDVFIVEMLAYEIELSQIKNLLGRVAFIESDLLRPAVFGSDIQRFTPLEPHQYLIYPYDDEGLIPIERMQKRYPRTLEYLSGYRSSLSSRSGVSSENWHSLVRRREESWMSAPKIVTRDLGIRNAFAPDLTGGVMLIGGTAVIPNAPAMILPLLAYLNSSTASDYLATIAPLFSGAFRKIEPQHLSKLPVPSWIIDGEAISSQLETLASKLVNKSKNADATETDQITSEIEEVISKALSS